MTKYRFILLIVCLLFILTAAFFTISSAATPPAIYWHVIAGGGGSVESADGNFAINSTIGQPAAGVTNSDLCSGFWCNMVGWITELHIYLPLTVKE